MQVLREIAEQTKIVAPELLDMPDIPIETGHIWQWFLELSRGRPTGWNVEPIPWADFLAYFDLYGFRPQSWELQALRLIDDAFIQSRNAPQKKAVGKASDFRMNQTGPQQLIEEEPGGR